MKWHTLQYKIMLYLHVFYIISWQKLSGANHEQCHLDLGATFLFTLSVLTPINVIFFLLFCRLMIFITLFAECDIHVKDI